jgi:hypothetical protein
MPHSIMGFLGQDSFERVGAEVLFPGDQCRRGLTSRESALKRPYFQGIDTDEDLLPGDWRRRGFLHGIVAEKDCFAGVGAEENLFPGNQRRRELISRKLA